MILQNGPSDGLQQHCLPCSWRRYNQSALSFTDGGRQVHHPGTVLFLIKFKLDAFLRIEWRQVIKKNFVSRDFRVLKIDLLHFEKSEIPLCLLRGTYLTRNNVSCAQIESPN